MSSIGRTWFQILAAGLLAWSGATAILYAGLLPMPPISDVPTPLAWQAFGALELVAAVGVFRQQAWGRALGVIVVAVNVVLGVFMAVARMPGSTPPEMLLGFGFSMAYGGIVLCSLLRHWPKRAEGGRT